MIRAPSSRACAANSAKYSGVACGKITRSPARLARPTFGSAASGLPLSPMRSIARSAAWRPTPWFAPIAATSTLARACGRLLGGDASERLRVLVEGQERDDRQRRDAAHRADRREQLVELVERLDHEEVDAATLEELRLLGEDGVAILHRPAERADRPGDEDVRAGHLTRVARDLHRGLVDRRDLVLEVVLGELAPVRAEGVRLDDVRAGADEAEVEREDALGRADVRLLGAAEPRDGARDERAHAAVADERRAVREALEEPAHRRIPPRPLRLAPSYAPRVSGALPTGTVTFLFTDVEGSTRLLEELGAEDYAVELGRHREIVRGALAEHGGVEVDTQGDAFFCAFGFGTRRRACAAEIQDALAAGPVRVRIGIHTGEALVVDRHYVGMDVHRAARIGACGHGGQVVHLALDGGLLEPERVRRFATSAHIGSRTSPRRSSFTSSATRTSRRSRRCIRTNLPVPATPFLGREEELAELVARASEPGVRVLTLTGPGGTGKTRLSLQLAAELSDAYPDGVWWVPLASASRRRARRIGRRERARRRRGARTRARRVDRERAGAQASAPAARQLRAPRRPGRDARCGGCEREPGCPRHRDEPRAAGDRGRARLSRSSRSSTHDAIELFDARARAAGRTPRPGDDGRRSWRSSAHGSTISRSRSSSLRPAQRCFHPPHCSSGCPRASTSSPVRAT